MSIKFFPFIILFAFFFNFKPLHSQELPTPDTTKYSQTRIFLEIIYSNLIICADTGNYEMIESMLKRGVNPNYSVDNGITPLMLAVDNGHYKITKILIDYGADVNAKPYDGNSAIFAAVRNNNDSIAELLINSNANLNEKNDQNLTPLHYACGFGYPYLTSLLIEKGAKINEKDINGNTPLMCSVYAGANISADILIESGANVNSADNNGNTPLMVAAQFNDTLLIQKLYSAGADINTQNSRYNNALTIAIENNAVNAFRKLLDLGISTEIPQNSKGYFQLAKEKGCNEIANILAKRGLKTRVSLNIGKINFYSGFSTRKNDFMLDFGGGIQESVTNLLVNFGFRYKPFSNRVLVYRDNVFYQFWEKRYSFYLSLQHLVILKRNPINGDIGFIPGLSNELTWRYYRGVNEGSGIKYLPIPSIGIFYQRNVFTIIGKWEFSNYYKQMNSSNRFSLQLIVSIPTYKRYINKKINWLN